MRVLFILTVVYSTVVLSDYEGACFDDDDDDEHEVQEPQGCSLYRKDLTPNSCSCHVCLDKTYKANDGRLAFGAAVPVGLQAQVAVKEHHIIPIVSKVTGFGAVTSHHNQRATVLHDVDALYVPLFHLCPPMVDTDYFRAHDQFPIHRTSYYTLPKKKGQEKGDVVKGPIYWWQTDKPQEHSVIKKWIASLPAVYYKGPSNRMYNGRHLHSSGASFYSAFELVFGTDRENPRFAHRGIDPNTGTVPKTKNPCGKKQQFALCTYDVKDSTIRISHHTSKKYKMQVNGQLIQPKMNSNLANDYLRQKKSISGGSRSAIASMPIARVHHSGQLSAMVIRPVNPSNSQIVVKNEHEKRNRKRVVRNGQPEFNPNDHAKNLVSDIDVDDEVEGMYYKGSAKDHTPGNDNPKAQERYYNKMDLEYYDDDDEQDGNDDWYQMDEGYYYEDDNEGMESYYYGEEDEYEGMNDDYYRDLLLYEQSVRNLKRAEELRKKAQYLLRRHQGERRY